MKDPIVITGAGIVSAVGVGKAATLDALRSARTGVGPVRYLQTAHTELPVGEVPLSDDQLKQRLAVTAEPTTRSALLGMTALDEALVEASLGPSPSQTVAFVNGTTVGGMDKSEEYYLDFLENDTRNAYIRTHDCGANTELIADRYGLFGQCFTVSTACSSAANAIILGANLLRSGQTQVAVAGGTECLTRFHLNGFNSLMIVDHGQCRPFDEQRAGLNLGEGAAYVVMEHLSSAHRRGAQVLACLAGYGNACDAFHQTASSDNGEGAFLAMRKALAMARLQPADISYVNAHGTGTPNNDLSESHALQRLFGQSLPPVSSTKGMTGHTTSASGAVEAVICLLALLHQVVPVNVGWQHPMADGIVPVMDTVPRHALLHAMCNSFGFGGNDSSLILSSLLAPRSSFLAPLLHNDSTPHLY